MILEIVWIYKFMIIEAKFRIKIDLDIDMIYGIYETDTHSGT